MRTDLRSRPPTAAGRSTGSAIGPVRGAAYSLSTAMALVAALTSALTFFAGGILTGPAVMNGSARGTALVVLVVADPAMVLAMWATSRGSPRGLVVWLGAAGYLFYNAVMFLFATPFNRLFVLNVARLSLSVWSIVAVLAGTDVRAWGAHISARLPARGIAAYTWVIVVLNALAWLRTIVPAVLSPHPASFLAGTGMTTSPVFVQDLAIWLPGLAVAALWLWQRRPWGALVVGLGLTFWLIESGGIAVDQWYGSRADPASSVASAGLVPVFAGLAVLGLIPLFFFFRAIDAHPHPRPHESVGIREPSSARVS